MEDYKEIIEIANYMRSKGAAISTHDVELAIRLYRSARALSTYSYFPLKQVLESVFVKRIEDEKIFYEAYSAVTGYKIPIHVNKPNYHKHNNLDTTINQAKQSGYKQEKNNTEFSWRELEEISLSKLRKKGITDPVVKEKVKLAKQLKNMKKYLETQDTAYLDLLETELKTSHKRWGERNSIEGRAIDTSFKKVYENLVKLVNNPNDPRALILLAREVKGDFAVKAIKYSLSKGNKTLAEHIASAILKQTRQGRRLREVRRTGWENDYHGTRTNIRKTLHNIVRGYPNKIVYKRKRKTKTITLIVDKSDSMRKHSSSIIEIASKYYNYTDKIVLFDEKVEVTRVTSSTSRAFLLDKLLKLDFSGYTNISRALRETMKESQPGSTIVIISDLEQTIEDEPYYKELERLARKKHSIIIYTLSKYIPELKQRLLSTRITLRPLEAETVIFQK